MNLSGTIINNCYIIRELLSENSIGSLWSAQPIFSAKQFLLFFLNPNLIKRNKEDILSFKKKIFSSFSEIYENIANTVEIDEFENNIYLSFEVGEVRSLSEYIKNIQNISLNNIYSIIEYIGKALEAMQEKNLIHGMLLPDYILLEMKQDSICGIKILNFYFNELCSIFDFKIDKENSLFFPLEIIENRFDDINKSSDLYFIGLAFYLLLTLNLNFKRNDIENVSNLKIDDEEVKNAVVKIIKKLLNKNKENRYPDINAFFEDFYLISKKSKKIKNEKKKSWGDSLIDKNSNGRDFFEQLDYNNKKDDMSSSKDRIDYFNRLETDRKKYYDRSDYEERKLYFEKLDRERREYYNRVANERKLFLDNLVANTRNYLNEISDRKVSNNNIDNRQKSYFEEITERTKFYAEKITDKIKDYYDYLSKESRVNIDKEHTSSALANSYFNNIVAETGRHYKNLVEEAKKYYLNLSNEAKNYSESIKIESSNEGNKEEKTKSETAGKNKFYNSLQAETIEYFKKLENKANDYSKKIVKEWESRSKKSDGEKNIFDEINEDREDFYKDKKEESATVKYFENLEKDKLEIKNEKLVKKEEKSDFQEYLEDRDRYYKVKSNGYKEEHTNYFNKSNDRIKQSFDEKKHNDKTDHEYQKVNTEEVNKKKSEYSMRNDFVKKNHWLSFFKKLSNNAAISSGNICIIDVGDDNNFNQFINKFKEMNLKKSSRYIDINCKDYKSGNVIKNILKKYEELKNIEETIKYDFDISSESEKNINNASEFILNLGKKKSPLIIILREIQSIDKMSLLILHKIIKRIPSYPLLIICTYRKNELTEDELLKKITS